jgi:ring-1,2-phenylacetyl-CoA epoxidase subunit PaaE
LPDATTYQTAVITSIRKEIPGVKTFTATYANGTPIPYAAGQFITFIFTHHGKEERRSFSISSHTGAAELSFTVKRVDNGIYSRHMADHVKPGDTLLTTGAAGLFTLPENINQYEQIFFFAAGIGITPVISLIKELLHTHPDKHIVLIYSNTSQGEVVFYNELQLLSEKYPHFKLELLYSSSFNLARARLNKSLLPMLLKEYGLAPKEKMLFYVCGPFQYMRMVTLSLGESGIHREQVKKENFNTNDRVVHKTEPPDKAPHMVNLSIGKAAYHFQVAYPETILQAAKKNGIDIPYSCEVGRCGSCAAKCVSGAVWLSYNEVLGETDLKKGIILTCVGHPVGGGVSIEM